MRCSRPRGSQIGAVVSHQSSVLAHGREELEQRERELQQVCRLNSLFCVQCATALEVDLRHMSCSNLLTTASSASAGPLLQVVSCKPIRMILLL